jgi:hypothetical protein
VGSVNPAVKDRIASVNSVLKKENMRLTIEPDCKKLIESLRKHTYKPDTRQPDKSSGYDHFCDSLGYLINNMYPLNQNVTRMGSPVRRNTGRMM